MMCRFYDHEGAMFARHDVPHGHDHWYLRFDTFAVEQPYGQDDGSVPNGEACYIERTYKRHPQSFDCFLQVTR
jgi:hypothetical protein